MMDSEYLSKKSVDWRPWGPGRSTWRHGEELEMTEGGGGQKLPKISQNQEFTYNYAMNLPNKASIDDPKVSNNVPLVGEGRRAWG